MKKLESFKAKNLTDDSMRRILGGRGTTYTTPSGGKGGNDDAVGGVTTFTSGDSAGQVGNGDVRTSR